MHKLIIGIFVIALFVLGYLIYTGKLNVTAFDPKLNNIPTLKDALSQTDKPLTVATSTIGLNGFADPNPAYDINYFQDNVLTKDIVSEDVVRAINAQRQSQIQVSTDTGTGQGIQTKTIDFTQALALLGISPSSGAKIPSGQIKLVTDPTSGLTSLSIDQATIQRAKTDPQLMNAILNTNARIVNKQLGIGV